MAVLCEMPTIRYLAWSARLSVCYDGYVTWLNSRSSLPVSALCTMPSTRVQLADVAENLGEISCMEFTGQGNDFNWFQW